MRNKYSLGSLNLPVLGGLVVYHGLAVYALFHFSRDALEISAGLFVLTAWVGVGMCYHRLLTHKAYETSAWLRYALVIVGTLSGQAGPLWWVDRHRSHHAHSDQEGDPHSPVRDGFSWSHVLWLVFREPEGKNQLTRVRKDLMKEPVLVFIDRFSWVPQVILGVLLFFFAYWRGGIEESKSWVSWGIGMRTTLVYHVTWFVNSAAHKWGYRNFETNDNSRNLWWAALLSGGEWHNGHHRFQRSARHGRGLRHGEPDMTYGMILVLSWLRLAWNLERPALEETKN